MHIISNIMIQKPKVRLVVRKRSAGNNIVSQSTLPKAFADAYHLETGDVIWFSVDRIVRKGDLDAKERISNN